MRVTHIITRLIVGGAQENTVSSVLGLAQRPGISVHLISGPTHGPEGSLEPRLEAIPGLWTLLPELVRPINPIKDFRALQVLTAMLKRLRPDIVHTHSGKAGLIGRMAAKRAGVPIIIHTIHGPSFGPFQGALSNLLFRSAERYAAKHTTHFVAVANAMITQYLAAGIGKAHQYTRILSGFNLAPFLASKNDLHLRARFGIGADDVVIGKIARLFKLKGHDDLIDAAPAIVRQIPNAKFLLIGDGLWRHRLEEKVQRLGLEHHFVFAGLVAPEEIPPLVGIMDFLVHLSLREGLPRALPQALAAARPVIAYDCDGAREVCVDGKTGWLVAPGDLRMLADRVIRLALDHHERIDLGRNGQAMVQQQFGVEKMVNDLEALYHRLLREP